MNRVLAVIVTGVLLTAVRADDPGDQPRPLPPTRPEMKQLLEDMKTRKPRIPLPELTDAEREKFGERGGYEARLRSSYMPAGEGKGGFGFSRGADPKTTLTYEFKTQLFWIVSRTNNCQYCIGHQEWKLAVAGMKEEEIAALDCDWGSFKPAQQVAYTFARKLTYEPNQLADADFDQLRKHYTDLQILEMILSIAGNNSINRWKEAIGVPQSKEGGGFLKKSKDPDGKDPAPKERPAVLKTFLTPTAEQYKDTISKVAPLQIDMKTGKPSRLAVSVRPPLEKPGAVEKALEACAVRKPRLPLIDEAKTREILPEDWQKGPLPQWVRLLANFPSDGKGRILSFRSAETKGDLSAKLKAQISWIVARQDRAWYAAGLARQRLQELGLSGEQIYQLDGSWKEYSAAERALFKLARNLAASPVVLTDDDVAEAVKAAGPRSVVQVISYTTSCASFDRITEAAQLALEK